MQRAAGAAPPQPTPTPPPPGPMDVITAIQLQLQGMCKAAADCLDASTQHGKADSVQIDTTVAELAETFVKLHDHVNRMAEDLPDASVTPAQRLETLAKLDAENRAAVEELKTAQARAAQARSALDTVTQRMADDLMATTGAGGQ